MMRVVFYDKERETFYAVGMVIKIDSCKVRVNGRLTNVWLLTLVGDVQRTLKQTRYEISTVEI